MKIPTNIFCHSCFVKALRSFQLVSEHQFFICTLFYSTYWRNQIVPSSKQRLIQFLCFIKVETSKTVGRYLVATRDLEPMELVLSDQAAASGPLHEDTVVCLGCLKALSLPSADSAIAICQDCGLPFCSTTCQDDVIHKAQARQFKRKGYPLVLYICFFRW